MNIEITIIITAIAALVLFLIIRNRKDRKKLFPPKSTDPVEEIKTDQERNRDKA